MKKLCLIIACLVITSVVAVAQAQPQNPVIEKTPSPKPKRIPQVNDKADPSQTTPVIDKTNTGKPDIEKDETKTAEIENPHPGKSGNHPHNNGANAHGMEMKEKNQVKQKEKKEEHAEKKAKHEEEKIKKKETK